MNWWIAKGFLLGLWLSSFGTIVYLYLAIYRRLPPGPGAVGTAVFMGYTTQNPFWWAGLVACFVIGFMIAKSWPGRPIFWIALLVTELVPVGILGLFLALVARMRAAEASAEASSQLVQLVIDPVIQKDAPVQVVAIKETGDNALATVTVKNATDRYVQDFYITWTVFRPANCAASGPALRIQQMTIASASAHAEDRGFFASIFNIRLPPGHTWGARVLKPHEQTEITSLSLTRESLLELAKKYNAKKLRVQVGIAYVNYTTGDKLTSRSGPPDWRDPTVEKTNILDADDAAKQACK